MQFDYQTHCTPIFSIKDTRYSPFVVVRRDIEPVSEVLRTRVQFVVVLELQSL